jgi:arabinose-5-phosphate isomerase
MGTWSYTFRQRSKIQFLSRRKIHPQAIGEVLNIASGNPMKVKDVMHGGDKLAIVEKDTNIDVILLAMTKKKLGAVCVVEEGSMVGIITEGDIRRALQNKEEFFSYKAADIMMTTFTSIGEDQMAVDALELMENRKSQISVLPVLEGKKLIGMIRIHDLLNSIN